MGDAVNLCEGDEMVLQNFFNVLEFIVGFLTENRGPSNQQQSSSPTTMSESGCLTVFTVNLIL
jgi:hypothetical protein